MGKFWMLLVKYDALVEAVSEEGVSGLFRSQGFMRMAAELFALFESYPALESIKVTAVVMPEINKETNLDVRLRHHFKIVTVGADLGFLSEDAVDTFVLEKLPYKTMGAGCYELTRQHSWVKQFLGLDSADEITYQILINQLAEAIDMSFGTIRVHHDLGMTSAN